MKKIAILMFIICMIVPVLACGNNTQANTSNVQGIASSIASEETAQWEAFINEMEKQGVSYDNIHSVENTGFSRQEIMAMSAEDISNLLAEIAVTKQQNKIALAKQMLADIEEVKNDPQFIFSNYQGTSGLHLIEQCVASIKANDWASVTGLMMGSPFPFVYEIEYVPDGSITLTKYYGKTNNEIGVHQDTITDIYEAALFYQFTDHKQVYFSIPKVSLMQENVEVLEAYPQDSDIDNAPISAAQAKETVAHLNMLLTAYLHDVSENKLGNPMNGYGVIVPENTPSQPDANSDRIAVVDGAAKILDKCYYNVSFYLDGNFTVDSYYIDAKNAENIFIVSMVDGRLIPVAYKNTEHFSVDK